MICQKCGAIITEGAKFCESCGAAVETGSSSASVDSGWDDVNDNAGSSSYAAGNNTGYGNAGGGYSYGGAPIKQRSIAVCIILTLITCGIYSLYWMYVLNEDVSHVAGEEPQTSGGMVILLSIVTCSIYMWYWLYKKGEQVSVIKSNNGVPGGSDAVLYLVLAIFGLSIIDLALMQDTVNKYGA